MLVLAVVALVAVGLPSRMLTQWAYAVERGKLQANTEELTAINQDVAQLEEISHAFRLVARVARPGVVHIHVEQDEDASDRIAELQREREQLIDELNDAASRLEDEEEPSSARDILRLYTRVQSIDREIEQLRERLYPGSGSGIVFDQDGHILTNNHVVEGRGDIRVTLADEREYDATLIGTDANTDVAVIKIDAPQLHPLRLGDSEQVQVGDWVVAVGAPFGLSHTVTHGIISATGRSEVITGRGIVYQDFLQTDAAINPGNSGGPLLNLRGEVVGLSTAIATHGNPYNAGIAFAIPSSMARRVATQLIETGQVARGWLGITMGELAAADREVLGVAAGKGVLVNSIIDGTPADQAGLLVEDVILSVNDSPVATMAELRGAIADISPGEKAQFGLQRGDERIELSVKLGRRPSSDELNRPMDDRRSERELPGLDLSGRTWLPSYAPYKALTIDDRGVLIMEIATPDPDTVPVKAGELIVACNGQPVQNLSALLQILEGVDKRQTLKLEVVDQEGERRTVTYTRD
jgi:serine protease Do